MGGASKRGDAAVTALAPVIADIRFPERLATIFEQYRPDVVFHAAAHKHVPLMEENLADAVANNVYGTQCVVDASVAAGVSHFVLISTDKAVNPTSIMGATKRIAERIVQHAARHHGRAFVAVRFGNVLGSRGSVVPFFQKQIAAGGPVTVTHPEMRRYFMTIPEAVQLVLQAATMGEGGEVFVLDMGEPVRILDLAHDLIRLSGLEPGRDIEIRFTGLRPGEKLYEELFSSQENYARTHHEKIFVCSQSHVVDMTPLLAETRVVAAEQADAFTSVYLRVAAQEDDTDQRRVPARNNGRVYGDDALFRAQVRALISAAQCADELTLRRHIAALVPEYGGNAESEDSR
jgi:FlaA1/EpsC-like NDP-sugar epimerase